jgi:hypothetical protein
MAYGKEGLEKWAVEAIEKYNLVFMYQVASFLPCSLSTFYDHKLQNSEKIKAALSNNRIKTKQSLMRKWYKSENATLQMGLFKLLATPEERKALSLSYIDQTITEKEDLSQLSIDELRERARLVREIENGPDKGE